MNEEWDESPDKNKKNKEIKPYSSTKRKIKKYIPKEKELSHITILDDKKKRESKIDTIDIKKQAILVSGIRGTYYPLLNKLGRYREELRLLKRELPSGKRHIEIIPKEIESLKRTLKEANFLLRKEQESPGYLKKKRIELLEIARRKMGDDNINKEEIKEIENISEYDLERLKKSIKNIERRMEMDFETLEDAKDHKIITSHKIEELEEIIQELEPIVRMLRDKLDKETKKLKAERSNNLMNLFDKEER